jgi:hypothetical protein
MPMAGLFLFYMFLMLIELSMSNIKRTYPKREVKDFAQRPFIQIDAELSSLLNSADLHVYIHIKRRAGGNGECWESIDHMSAEVSMSSNTLRKSIRSLLVKNLIGKEVRKGSTDLYTLNPPELWKFDLPQKKISESSEVQNLTKGGSKFEGVGVQNLNPNKIPVNKIPLIPRSLEKKYISNADAIAKTKESAHAESFSPYSSENPIQDALTRSSEETYQESRDEGSQSLLDAGDKKITPHCESNTTGEDISAASRSINLDKTSTLFGKPRTREIQQQKALKDSFVAAGITSKRWKDLDDYKNFVAYVENHAQKKRRIDPLFPGELCVSRQRRTLTSADRFGESYVISILQKTAKCLDENSPDLVLWKLWNTEPPPSKYERPIEREIPVGDGDKLQGIMAELRQKRLDREADKLAEQQRINNLISGIC